MASSADQFLKKTLGEDFLESLQKFEIYKPGTRTVIDHEEIKTALMIVPRTLMGLLINNLSSMEIGETKEIQIPLDGSEALLRVNKVENDVYNGQIEKDSKKVTEFQYRSIPGIGLIIMSTFELYDTSKLVEEPKESEYDSQKLQDLIDNRLALHDLINKVVDKKISERDGLHQMFLNKLSELVKLSRETAPMSDPYFQGMANGIEVINSVANNTEPNFVEAPKKGSPLKDFLNNRKNKKPEFKIELVKGEQIACPDCNANIFDGDVFSACVCYGDCGKVFIKKSENGIKVRFSKNWDAENINMVLQVLRNKNEGR